MRAARSDLFVGRLRELAVLRTRLAAARHGQGGVVLLIGEPGIGKTRMLD
jgi:predicted ATPase